MWSRLPRPQRFMTSSIRRFPRISINNSTFNSNTPLTTHTTTVTTTRHLSHTTSPRRKSLPPRPTLPDDELKHTYLKGSGPGGQKINKTSSAVQLTHLPTGIVVKSQATRSRSQNHTIARRILAEKIEFLAKGEDSRAAKVVERKQRRKQSASKKKKRKYRKLATEEQEGVEGYVGVEGEGDAEEEEDDAGDQRVEREVNDVNNGLQRGTVHDGVLGEGIHLPK